MRMYSDYFGFRENAFAITPDPRYLFMSERHREALAHLLFGTEEGGGFVQLTGEVGTGKTTICRAFLEQLPENVDVALLLNPPDSERELLLGIAAELRLALPRRDLPVRELVDLLNARLLRSHADGRRTVVIIDEAQNIRDEVLEQVRLLTNLETPTHKLLQVFLIGQPELRQKLEQPALRQVAQRITARYHLEPLNLAETNGYIGHRLAVAGCRQGLFSPAAVKQIFRQSKGIPRVINILCDRALLGAFASDSAQVTADIVRLAAREWRGETGPAGLARLSRPALAAAVAGLVVAAAAGFAGNGGQDPSTALASLARSGTLAVGELVSRVQDVPASGVPKQRGLGNVPEVEQHAQAERSEPAQPSLTPLAAANVDGLSPQPAMREPAAPDADKPALQQLLPEVAPVAFAALLSSWGIEGKAVDRLALCETAASHGLRCLRDKGGWDTLRGYNRPALLTLNADGKESYLALVGMNAEHALVATPSGVRQLAYRELDGNWNGEFVMLWRPPLEGVSLISAGSAVAAVSWLHKALGRVDGRDGPPRGFDSVMQQRLRDFQRAHGLLADGIAGPRTLIHLNTLIGEREYPMLVGSQDNS